MSKFPTIDGVIIINANYILGIDISGLAEGGVWFSDADGAPSVDASNLFWDDINKALGIGTSPPGNKLDIVTGSITNSAVHIGESIDAGGYISSTLPHQLILAGGSELVSGSETARNARASRIRMNNGSIFFDTDMGLTVGNTFTPTERMKIDFSGNVGIAINPQEKLSVNGIINIPKASTSGIKVDLTTPTFGFADIIGDQFSKNTGATKPTLATYNGAINAWQFGAGDEAYMSFHIPHDYVKGTPIFLHVHWSHIATTVTGGTLTFKATSILSKSHNQQAFQSTPSVGTFTGTASTTQYQQILSEVLYSDGTPTGLQIDTDNLEPDSVIEMTFELDANNITVSGGGVPDPFIHFVDIHYQTTGIIGTKDKVPDFYT